MKKFLDYAVGVFIGVALVAPAGVYSATIYSAGSLLQTGDVKTGHVLNRTLLDEDVSNSAQISGTKIAPRGTQGTVLVTNGTNIATSSLLTLSTTTNTFTISATTSLAASTTINGVNYYWPTAQGSSGQTVVNDGNGSLSWTNAGLSVQSKDGTSASTNSTSFVVLKTVPINANSLGTAGQVVVKIVVHGTNGNNQKNHKISIGNGSATTTIHTINHGAQNATDHVFDVCTLYALGTTNSQVVRCEATTNATIASGSNGTVVTSIDSTAKMYISVEANVVNTGDTANYKHSQVIAY